MKKLHLLTLLAGVGLASSAGAATFSDTYIGYRYGSEFAEPFNNNNISKSIVNLSNVSGYKYGTNFFNVDLLLSDKNDPASAAQTNTGAQEAYVVYRHTLSLSAVSGTPLKYGYIRDVMLQGGFDWNTKSDAGYNSKKQMLVVGPAVSLDVPGFLDVALLEFYESNAPYSTFTNTGVPRYHYDPHPALSLAFDMPVPIADLPLNFAGYALWIASKGKDEFGNATVAETHFDVKLLLDVGKVLGGPAGTFKAGVAYEYWQNKFGNNASIPFDPANGVFGAGKGAFAHTPMLRAEYHF